MRFALACVALAATVSAAALTAEEQKEQATWGSAKVVNRCPYDVYLWSVDKEMGCSAASATKLSTGETYSERYRNGTKGGGISLKLSKFNTCGGKDISQLEYKIDTSAEFKGNYLDMSFVDCINNLEDCPGRTDGYYMRAGSQTGVFKSAENNQHCPVFSVNNAEEAAKVSYIKWDDPQTKFCSQTQDTDLYLCGGHAPDEEESAPAPESSSAAPSYSEVEVSIAPKPTSTKQEKPAPSSSAEDEFVVAAAAAVSEAPTVTEAPVVVHPTPIIKTEVVYVTEYINRRHAHARRHQHFHA